MGLKGFRILKLQKSSSFLAEVRFYFFKQRSQGWGIEHPSCRYLLLMESVAKARRAVSTLAEKIILIVVKLS